jgi:16S rRNA (adenine1518-N6/adenine1519-N6)-dimethyltransferase
VLGQGEIRDLLERHGLEARRSLGQNFVADPNTVAHIARLAGVGSGDRVVEVGPGLGSLTLALAATGAQVLAVEKDRTLLPVLSEVLATEPAAAAVQIVEGDALDIDWADVLGSESWTLVANLPYNVAVPVVMRLLAEVPQVQRLVVMVQLEVAERLCATPGDRTIGIPTIKVAWWASARILTTVPPEVFIPRPRVQSAVVGIERRPVRSDLVGPSEVFPLVERAYRQRRKMLRSTLGSVVPVEVFAAAGIDPQLRPERLDLDDWIRLAEAVVSVRGDGQ